MEQRTLIFYTTLDGQSAHAFAAGLLDIGTGSRIRIEETGVIVSFDEMSGGQPDILSPDGTITRVFHASKSIPVPPADDESTPFNF